MAYTAIDNPELYFQIKLYTGDGSTPSITLDGDTDMQPDMVWIKNRDEADSHCLFDAVRGATKLLSSDNYNAETTDADTLTSFDSDGFALGADVKVNTNTEAYVAWCWKANGTGSSNTAGSINTTATSANTTAGFSIVTYAGTGSAATVGHGLGVAPALFLIKNRDSEENWMVGHHGQGFCDSLFLNLTAAKDAGDSYFNDTAPTSTLFSIGTNNKINESGSNIVVYAFAEIQGYSKFGSYTGNGSQDGTFVYTGFKPAFIIAKRTDAAKNWYLADSTRSPNNIVTKWIMPHSNAAENTSGDTTDAYFDILSNGFKMRQDFSHLNADGAAHIYMAFAENPFVTSGGVPCTAR